MLDVSYKPETAATYDTHQRVIHLLVFFSDFLFINANFTAPH